MGQIAPMLVYQGVSNVKLLGTNIWNSNDFIRRGQKNVEGALFVDSPLSSDPNFKNSKFANLYRKTFGDEPGMFEAQGFEAGLLLRQIIDRGERSRVGLAQTLGSIQQFTGASGPMSMNAQRELVRPLQPLAVKEGRIVGWNKTVEKEINDALLDKEKAKLEKPKLEKGKTPSKPKRLTLKK
jgi:branched-chain amino acid transport system substrate-binding protein